MNQNQAPHFSQLKSTPQAKLPSCRLVLTYLEKLDGVLLDPVGPGLMCAVAILHEEGQEPQTALYRQSTDPEAFIRDAISQGQVLLSCTEIKAAEKGLAYYRQQAALKCFEDIQQKLKAFAEERHSISSEIQVLGLLSDIEDLKALRFAERSAIVLHKNSASPDLSFAQAIGRLLSRQKLALLKIEESLYPWHSDDILEHSRVIKKLGSRGYYKPVTTWVRDSDAEKLRKKKILLHVCCGPDAAGVINQLKRDFEVLCFWYDPNIQPREEHDKRLDAFLKVATIEQVPVIIGEYDVQNFYDRIQGLEHTPEQGAKCSQCYDLRLERSAIEARDQGCDLYTTTLAISPHKVQEKLKAFGELNFKKHKVPYLARNFMKDDGFKKSVEYTRDYSIYRQDYCGCYFSMPEGGAEAKKQAQALKLEAKDLKAGLGNPYRNLDQDTPYIGRVEPSPIQPSKNSTDPKLRDNNSSTPNLGKKNSPALKPIEKQAFIPTVKLTDKDIN